MIERLRAVLTADSRIAYGLVFGSEARGEGRPDSDVDVAVGLVDGCVLTTLEIGALTSALEAAAGRVVDLVLLAEAPPALAFRIIREGRPIVVRDPKALAGRRAKAILDYLDFRPIEDLFVRGVLAARRGR